MSHGCDSDVMTSKRQIGNWRIKLRTTLVEIWRYPELFIKMFVLSRLPTNILITPRNCKSSMDDKHFFLTIEKTSPKIFKMHKRQVSDNIFSYSTVKTKLLNTFPLNKNQNHLLRRPYSLDPELQIRCVKLTSIDITCVISKQNPVLPLVRIVMIRRF